MHCLYCIGQAGYDFQLKGGTSLSKGHGIIHHFSEDIDLHITPPENMSVKTSRNHTKEQHCKSRKDYYDYLATHIKIPGIINIERDAAFDAIPRYFSGGIRLIYNAKYPSDGNAKEGILLEVGFDDRAPNHSIDISSWALEFTQDKNVDVLIEVEQPVTQLSPQVSSPKELPLQTLSEPYVNLSTHTAPIVQPFLYNTPQWTKILGCRSAICLNHFVAFR